MAIFATGRTIGVAEEVQLAELARTRIVGHKASYQRLSDAQQEFNRLGCLQQPNNSGKHAQQTRLCTAWSKRSRWRLWIETAITRPFIRLEDRQLALKTEDAAMHDRLIGDQCSIVQEIARGEVIGAVKNDIVVGNDACHVTLVQPLDVRNHLHIRVQRFDGFARRLSLILTNTLRVM